MRKMEKMKKYTLLKKIGISILLIMSMIILHQSVEAVTVETKVDVEKLFDKSSMMPARNTAGGSGMLPQYYGSGAKRNVTLEDSRLLFPTNSWKATMDGEVVYCADYGSYVRYAKYDANNIHWLKPAGTVIQEANIPINAETIGEKLQRLETRLNKKYKDMAEAWVGYVAGSYKMEKSVKLPGPFNAMGYLVGTTGGETGDDDLLGILQEIARSETNSHTIMENFLKALGKEMWPGRYSSSIDAQYGEPTITATQGPEVVVMEQSSGGKAGYAETGGTTYTNDKKAFIFSASEDAYGSKDYASEYTLNDIQGAYWKVLEEEGGRTPTTHLTANAIPLYEKAKEYEKFGGKFTASIDDSQAQVIVDRDNKEYIVGPYSVSYPFFEDISYMKSIVINNDENLLYDESHDGIEIILENGKGTGTMIPGSNGMEKEYPRPGQKFFVKFSAEKAGFPKEVTLDVRFEYINSTKATLNAELQAQANIYRYYGYCQILGGLYPMKDGSANYTFSWRVKHERTENVKNEDGTDKIGADGKVETTTTIWYETIVKHANFTVYMPYVMMKPEYKSADAQELSVIGKAEREYKIVGLGSTIGTGGGITIDLTMELGGYVWVDEDGGKESLPNGIDNGETRVPNVQVTLYKEGGEQIGTTKTNANGEYRFTDLNSMYQYYVKFRYNGQYYEPTTYASSDTWYDAGWQTNSNATDKTGERVAFNAKFASIGSSPENYMGPNKTYTREELFKAGAIDEFGNPTGGGDASMQQYVQDSLMDAYTGPGSGSYDLYPVPSLFVIDTFQYPCLYTPNADVLYPNAYYINLGLHPRQDSDLAIKKDVDHVDLEINGQTHRYTYDTIENKIEADNSWTIGVNLSDASVLNTDKGWRETQVSDAYRTNYGTSYSRELYKSDYIYKASMYGEKMTELGKSKSDELEIYITYKIMVRNQALSIRARVDELVDYYDQDLEYIDERSYIEVKRSSPNAAQKGRYSVGASNTTRYSGNTVTKINGYDNLYVTGLSTMGDENSSYLAAGQTAYVYLTFKVKKDRIDNEDWVKLDEDVVSAAAIGVGKENIVEINGYSTQYAQGTQVPNVGDVSFKPAGIVDRDSNPGNLNPADVPKDGAINYNNFEDDTDKAPNIRIILYRDDETNRVIVGNVWEDARTESIGVTTTGDGIRQDKETLINGVTVQLVELMENGKEYVWREFGAPATQIGEEIGGPNTIEKGTGTGTKDAETPIINYKGIVPDYKFETAHNGQYAFKSFMPGKYVVRFIYGDTVRTVTPSSLKAGGLNEKSYNGQDYKSTTYQEGINQNLVSNFRKANVWKNENNNLRYIWHKASTWNLGIETLGEVLTEVSTFKADASNNETAVATQNIAEQKGYVYDITASDAKKDVSDAKDIESRRNEVVDYSDNDVTNYIAEVLASHKSDYDTMNDRNQLLKDLMTNTKMKAETGMMVIELEYDKPGTENQTQNNKPRNYKIENVDLGLEERAKSALVLDKEVTNVKLTLADGSILFDAQEKATNVLWRDHKVYDTAYKGNILDETKFKDIQNIREKNANKFGLIQLTMDEELMHGATIEITYRVTVTNVGEVDYKDNAFYYTGNKSGNAKVVTTRADQVIDYVANNLQFDASRNSNWKVIDKDEIRNQGLVNEKLKEQVNKYNTIIITDKLNADLVPNLYKEKVDNNAKDSVNVPLVLTQLITAENDADDLTYKNIVEIVKTSNTVGRRMEYSVVGNQDPTEKPQELDSDMSEIVRILPPFGNAGRPIIIIAVTLLSVITLVGGIFFIKNKVLRK